MNKLFNVDSPFMVYLSRLADMVILSILWLICSIPIITIGPSTAALYYVALKMVRKEEIKITASFFHAFKANFKQGVILNLIFLVVGTVLALDYIIMSGAEGTAGAISSGWFLALGIWMLCIMFYTYPMQAQFINPIRITLKNAAVMAMRKLVTTIIVFALNMIPAIVVMISLELFIKTLPIWSMMAPGVIAYVCSMRFVKIFDPLIQPAKSELSKLESD